MQARDIHLNSCDGEARPLELSSADSVDFDKSIDNGISIVIVIDNGFSIDNGINIDNGISVCHGGREKVIHKFQGPTRRNPLLASSPTLWLFLHTVRISSPVLPSTQKLLDALPLDH